MNVKYLMIGISSALMSPGIYAHAGDVDQWIRPLIGTHSLKGSPGCESIEIRDIGGSVYDVEVGDMFGGYISRGAKISKNSLSQYDRTGGGVFGCGQQSKIVVEMTIADDGKLKSLYTLHQTGNGCVVLPGGWKTISEFKCK